MDDDSTRSRVREHYARAVTERGDCCSDERTAKASRLGYAPGDIELVPVEAASTSFGCANPVALADLRPGEVVLDLGSGAGRHRVVPVEAA